MEIDIWAGALMSGYTAGIALGSTSYLISGLSLYSGLGRLPDWIKAHAYINGGAAPLSLLPQQPSVSYGLGAVLSLGGIRAEVGWTFPLARKKTDVATSSSFSLGIGAAFL